MVKIMFINQHTFSSMIFPYVWCLQNPSKPINVWWLNPRDFTPLNKALRPGRATSWLPRDDRPRSTPLDAQSRTSPAKSAKCPWLGKSSSFVVKLLGNITSSSFFRTPKWWEKNTSNEASCLWSKTLMDLMEPMENRTPTQGFTYHELGEGIGHHKNIWNFPSPIV